MVEPKRINVLKLNFLEINGENKEDGALLGQVKLEIKVEVGVQIEVSHDCPSGRVGGGLVLRVGGGWV